MIVAHGMYLADILWFVLPVAGALWFLRRSERRARERAEAAEPGDEQQED